MEDKDLVWRDYKIEWPKRNYIYYNSETNTDNLAELSKTLHANSLKLNIIDKSKPVSVVYERLTRKLIVKNCSIDLSYTNIDKLKVKGVYNE